MAIQSQAQIDAFRNVARSQGFGDAEIESIVQMGVAANQAKQAEKDKAKADELSLYEQKLKLSNQYNPPASSEKSILSQPSATSTTPAATSVTTTPSTTGKTLLDEVTDGLGNFDDIIRSNPGLTDKDILTLARANVNKYGPFKESDAQLRALGLGIIADEGLNVGSGASGENGKVLGYVEQLENGTSKSIKDVPAEDRGEVVEYLKNKNIDVYKLQKEREGKQSISVIGGLFNDFYGGTGIRGGGDDLSGKGILSLGIPSLLIRARAAMGLGRAANYKSTKDAILASLKSITGDNGVMSDQDIERISKLLPNAGANPDYAQRQWEKINQILVDKYGAGFMEDRVALDDVGKSSTTSSQPGMLGKNQSSSGIDQFDMDLINKYKK